MTATENPFVGMEMRAALAKAAMELMAENKDIVMMDADLASASGFNKIFQAFPEQCINAGICEANMMGMAAGMSLLGKIPFVHSFAPFAVRRTLDQIYMSGVYQRANIRIFGTDPGYWAAHNGGTHTTVEDISVLRALPEMQILAPSDPVMMDFLVRYTAKEYGMFYIRSARKVLGNLYAPGKTFDLAKPECVREGDDLVIFACGVMVHEALAAAKVLSERGIEATVVDVFCIKPLANEALHPFMEGKKLVIAAENHSRFGGLGSLVAESMAAKGVGIPLRQVAINDRFGEVGTVPALREKYGLRAEDIIAQAEAVLC